MNLKHIVRRLVIEALLQRHLVKRDLARWPLLERVALAGGTRVQDLSVRECDERWDARPERSIAAEAFSSCSLQEEIDALAETGGTLFLPAGCKELTVALEIPSHVRVLGCARKTTLVFRGTAYGFIILGDDDKLVSGVHLENLILRHVERPPEFTATVFLAHARDIVLRELDVVDADGIGFFFADNTNRVQVTSCSVYRAAVEGFLFLRSVSDVLLTQCIAQGCGQSGMLLADWRLLDDMDALDFNAQAHHAGSVVGFAADDPGPVRITLDACVMRGNRKMGVCTDGTGFLRVMNSTIADNQCEGITLDNGTWCAHIMNCHIVGNGRRALQHELELNEDFVNQDGLMDDGSSRIKLPGISSDNAVYCRIENNLIENNYGDGVKFVRSAYACTVKGNSIISNNRGGDPVHWRSGVLIDAHPQQRLGQITFPCTQLRVVDNDIIGKHRMGITIAPGCVDNEVYGNRIDGYEAKAISNTSLAPNSVQEPPIITS